ncbi:2'-deoxynucleoside 5'-phosphate N-hydrolase 1 [Strongylocentrotus purpuratus]|uniref:Putative 2'-deoxynucleoside 5'-phosphate N-hydrolase 1 n=1 Tax=Strongylocentrotus purpuratus TaxID=7668 RepID=A0A7M7PQQ8_STRPU|nr:2'-deoxynucleoside 5'-phosphate N-hydrolase 1 [Strongylocentrotus purpuratus]
MGDRGLKIYFCGSIQGGRQDAELYTRIIKQLKQYGQVLTEVIGNKDVLRIEAAVTEAEIYEQDIEWLASADVVVAEVTQPSLGVGVELGRAQLLKKKVLCLFRPQEGKILSAMVRGAHDGELFMVKDYREEDLPTIFSEFFRQHAPFHTNSNAD